MNKNSIFTWWITIYLILIKKMNNWSIVFNINFQLEIPSQVQLWGNIFVFGKSTWKFKYYWLEGITITNSGVDKEERRFPQTQVNKFLSAKNYNRKSMRCLFILIYEVNYSSCQNDTRKIQNGERRWVIRHGTQTKRLVGMSSLNEPMNVFFFCVCVRGEESL